MPRPHGSAPAQARLLEYAELCGAFGVRVTDAEQLDDALAAAAAYDGPSLVEVISDPELI